MLVDLYYWLIKAGPILAVIGTALGILVSLKTLFKKEQSQRHETQKISVEPPQPNQEKGNHNMENPMINIYELEECPNGKFNDVAEVIEERINRSFFPGIVRKALKTPYDRIVPQGKLVHEEIEAILNAANQEKRFGPLMAACNKENPGVFAEEIKKALS